MMCNARPPPKSYSQQHLTRSRADNQTEGKAQKTETKNQMWKHFGPFSSMASRHRGIRSGSFMSAATFNHRFFLSDSVYFLRLFFTSIKKERTHDQRAYSFSIWMEMFHFFFLHIFYGFFVRLIRSFQLSLSLTCLQLNLRT